jgi:hypothetical protein
MGLNLQGKALPLALAMSFRLGLGGAFELMPSRVVQKVL